MGDNDTSVRAHVCTINLACVQSKELRSLLSCGLNHIPLRQKNLSEAMDELIPAWLKIASLLKLSEADSAYGTKWLKTALWDELKTATL